jgi:hypothetical protein
MLPRDLQEEKNSKKIKKSHVDKPPEIIFKKETSTYPSLPLSGFNISSKEPVTV